MSTDQKAALQQKSLEELIEYADENDIPVSEDEGKEAVIEKILAGGESVLRAQQAEQQAAIERQKARIVPSDDPGKLATVREDAPPEPASNGDNTAPAGLGGVAAQLAGLGRPQLDQLGGIIDRLRGGKGPAPVAPSGPTDRELAGDLPIDKTHTKQLTQGWVLQTLADEGHKVDPKYLTPGSAVIRRGGGFADHTHEGQAFLSVALADGRKIVVRIEGLAEEAYDEAKAQAEARLHELLTPATR